MIRAAVRDPHTPEGKARERRRRFGLDAPLPADGTIVARAILRHLESCRPDTMVLALSRPPDPPDQEGPRARVNLAAGVPDLMLVLPSGRLAFLVIKTQAQTLSRAERAFADLCRARSVPIDVVRSLTEARRVLDRLGLPSLPETIHGHQEDGLARRTARPAAARP